ncbi:MAG: polymerase sigma factor, FliA/WhiG family [Gemmatimonadetes bacterium]|jgi:RNA polymerase sigma factor for flagellar operon FliA|nr:polymerase sigma factor, FliA/WhiG family [Gemmatimonadota bacterium]
MGTLSSWASFSAGDVDARDALLTENLSLVHHVARQLARSLAGEADYDELVSAGTLGLIAALQSFDASRGLAFSTFAVPRIRGSILDELRRQDHVPRSVRRKAREIAAARESLGRTLGRCAEDSEIAEHLGVDVHTVWRWQADVEGAMHVSLDRPSGERDGGTPAPADFLSASDEAADDRLSREQEVVILREAILRLKDQERTVLTLHYFEGLNLHEIADVIGLTQSRVSQIRSKALGRLRESMAPIRATA